MKIMVSQSGIEYEPERCPFGGSEPQVFDCEHAELHSRVRCAYEHTESLHVDPPMNCPLRQVPAAILVHGQAS